MTILRQDPKYSDFDATPFAQAREDLRDLVTMPLQAWMLTSRSIRRARIPHDLLSIPLDLAAADFAVTVSQSDRGWYVEVVKKLTTKQRLHLVGQARSYLSALYQLADSATGALDRLEREARAQHERTQEGEVAA